MNTTATGLYNTAHPLAESGKPIFIPFGEWPYDKTTRQRLDRAHGEAIANELNERVARGEPGIPVYQGHPDVPALAAKYPDKGALGWVTKIALANEAGKDGLALTVEWDRDPGKGFKWFSPYWFANEKDRDGQTYLVANIRSIGLVNNPNIPEFRLANEAQPEERKPMDPYQLPQHIIDLANEYDESKHPRASDGKWTSGPGGASLEETRGKLQKMLKHEAISVAAGGNPATAPKDAVHFEYRGKRYYVGKDSDHMVKQFEDAGLVKRISGSGGSGSAGKTGGGESLKDKADKLKGPADQFIRFIAEGGSRKDTLDVVNGELLSGRWRVKNGGRDEDRVEGLSRRKAAHRLAILSGFKFNRGTGKYE